MTYFNVKLHSTQPVDRHVDVVMYALIFWYICWASAGITICAFMRLRLVGLKFAVAATLHYMLKIAQFYGNLWDLSRSEVHSASCVLASAFHWTWQATNDFMQCINNTNVSHCTLKHHCIIRPSILTLLEAVLIFQSLRTGDCQSCWFSPFKNPAM